MLTYVTVGHNAIPRNVACCEVTVNLPSFAATATAGGTHVDSVFVVDDLTQHKQLCQRPYVTEYPYGRFYAGVPITTPAGINIGAYCILDDVPRAGISPDELTFMRDMSQTVMAHLDTVRALYEREQTTHLVNGLGDFVRNSVTNSQPPPTTKTMPVDERGDSQDSVVPTNVESLVLLVYLVLPELQPNSHRMNTSTTKPQAQRTAKTWHLNPLRYLVQTLSPRRIAMLRQVFAPISNWIRVLQWCRKIYPNLSVQPRQSPVKVFVHLFPNPTRLSG